MRTAQRIVENTTGSLVDRTLLLNDFRQDTVTLEYNTGEYVYVASEWPFNSKFFDVTTANDQTSSLQVQIYDGNSWTNASDILDDTAVNGVSLARSGYVYFIPDRNKSWAIKDFSNEITELSSTDIRNMYWVRFSWSSDLNAATAINYLGHKFCETSEIYSLYPDLSSTKLLRSFDAAKTDWEEQIFIASDVIIRDLKRKGVIFAENQVLENDIFRDACIHKVAEIIYSSLGKPYIEQRNQAAKDYEESSDLENYRFDADADGQADRAEKFTHVARMHR